MTELQILDIMYQTFQTAVKLTMPFLLISMVVGVVIAIFQAATQINEQTLTFVPKFLAILVVMGLLGSTLLSTLQDFFRQMLVIIVGS
ncbi:MAG: flagellar biosynthetic protein FliQ [Hungatella sp.]|nr:flagellar biosynthetic protein FliQ [Hungatella sp.]